MKNNKPFINLVYREECSGTADTIIIKAVESLIPLFDDNKLDSETVGVCASIILNTFCNLADVMVDYKVAREDGDYDMVDVICENCIRTGTYSNCSICNKFIGFFLNDNHKDLSPNSFHRATALCLKKEYA